MDKDDGFRDRAKSMNGAKRWMTHYDTVCTNSNRPVYAARRDARVEAKRHCSTRAGAVKKKAQHVYSISGRFLRLTSENATSLLFVFPKQNYNCFVRLVCLLQAKKKQKNKNGMHFKRV